MEAAHCFITDNVCDFTGTFGANLAKFVTSVDDHTAERHLLGVYSSMVGQRAPTALLLRNFVGLWILTWVKARESGPTMELRAAPQTRRGSSPHGANN